MFADFAVRFAAALPSSAAPLPVLVNVGLVKSRAVSAIQPVDGVFADFRDEGGLAAEAEAARREGFTGKLAIHPGQVAVINAAFTPSSDEVKHAEAIVAAFEANPDAGVLAVDGRMVDRPHLVQARRVLERVR